MVRTNKYNCIKQKSTHRVLFFDRVALPYFVDLVGAAICRPSELHAVQETRGSKCVSIWEKQSGGLFRSECINPSVNA